jgi:uncharacterized protein (TIGR02453 family)
MQRMTKKAATPGSSRKTPFAGFPPETLRFLRALKRNNNREWFLQNKAVFEEKVKAPMLSLVEELGGAIQGFAPELNTDPKRAIFRIYRDTRFSADKTPYKTQIAAHFSPRSPNKQGYAGLYFHISPEDVLIAGGIYMPGSEELREIRNYIADHADELRTILRNARYRKYYGELQGEKAKRAPRGFAPDHPEIDLLRFKHYIAWTEKPTALAETPELFPTILEGFILAMPLIRYLNVPLGLKA